MSEVYVLDACALIALLAREAGAETVRTLLCNAYDGEAHISMHKLNLLEVYYEDYRVHGEMAANDMLGKIKKLPVSIISEISDEIFAEAGRLKASYRISLADSIALAEASVSGASLMTADHHEFDVIEKSEKVKFHWIR